MQRSTGWGSKDADPIRFGLSCGLRPAGRLERGPDRCSRVRFPGGAVLNCWDGGAAKTASSEKADGSPVTKVNHFHNGLGRVGSKPDITIYDAHRQPCVLIEIKHKNARSNTHTVA